MSCYIELPAEVVSYYRKVERLLDPLNIKILSLVYELGPGNLFAISRSLGENPKKIYYRFKILRNNVGITIRALPSNASLGLANCILKFKVNPDKLDITEDVFTNLKVPAKTYRTYGGKFNLFVQMLVPFDKVKFLEGLLGSLAEKGFFEGEFYYEIEKYSEFYTPRIDFSKMCLAYNPWKYSIETLREVLDTSIKDHGKKLHFEERTDNSNLLLDKIDLKLLAKLSRDATTPISRIASEIGISPAGLKYHLDKHVIQRRLIRGYYLYFPRYPPNMSEMLFVEVNFKESDLLERFSYVLTQTPYLHSIAKKIGENKILMLLEFYCGNVSRFLSLLSDLCSERVISSFSFYHVDREHIYVQYMDPELYDRKEGWLVPDDLGLSESLKDLGLAA